MLIEFHDQRGRSDHDAFVDWRISHCCDENGENEREGYFLTIRRDKAADLHAWSCRQRSAGGVNWDEFFGSHPTQPLSLTRTSKVCSDDRSELLAWADSHGIQVVICTHCLKQSGELPDSEAMNAVENVQAIEGIARETTITTRSRSEPLRRAALKRAAGICEACGTNYSELAGGLGLRVLQVHHRRQLALAEAPVTNDLDDLAVVCANCHFMIHADTLHAMPVEELRDRLRGRDASPASPFHDTER